MWLIFVLYLFSALAVDGVSKTAGLVMLILGVVVLAAVFVKVRPRSGQYAISTQCEKCEASLQGVGGMPRATCHHCGQRQSWSRQR